MATADAPAEAAEVIPARTLRWASGAAAAIRVKLRRTTLDLIEAGQLLRQAKRRLPHGAFGPWLEESVGLNRKTVWKLMQAAKAFEGRMSPAETFEPSALYLLGSPSAPAAARNAALELAAAGRPVTAAVARQLLAEARPGGVSADPRGLSLAKDPPPPAADPGAGLLPENWKLLELLLLQCHTVHITVDRPEGADDTVVTYVGSATASDGGRRHACRSDLGELIVALAGGTREKVCGKCRAKKPLDRFSRDAGNPDDGRNRYCLACERERVKAHDRARRAARPA